MKEHRGVEFRRDTSHSGGCWGAVSARITAFTWTKICTHLFNKVLFYAFNILPPFTYVQ